MQFLEKKLLSKETAVRFLGYKAEELGSSIPMMHAWENTDQSRGNGRNP
jgi:hypothetical protein